MAIPISFTAEARLDFDQAVAWYLERRSETATEFLIEVEKTLLRIVSDPTRFESTYAGCRECRVRRFPFSLVFRCETEQVVVVAIAHASRRPGFWIERK